MKRTYEIHSRPNDLGGGWKLTLLENGQEAGGGVYPISEEDPRTGMDWWNAISETQRTHWLMMAASAMPAAARYAYRVAMAYSDAMEEGESWSRVNL